MTQLTPLETALVMIVIVVLLGALAIPIVDWWVEYWVDRRGKK